MNNARKIIRHTLLGTLTCFLILVVSTEGLNHVAAALSGPSNPAVVSQQLTVGQMVDANLSVAQSASRIGSTAMSQSKAHHATTMTSYVAVLSKHNVVPTAPMTSARGAVGAVLVGDRLVVRGSFADLSSAMRDYRTDPVNPPNANITSAFHIHQGDASENGPFQYALDVMMDDTGHGGNAMGEYMLTNEQLQALADGKLYVDLHTTVNRGGELRGLLMPVS